MYNLFIFIKKYSSIILFVVLEVICIIMIVQSLPYHNRKMVSVSNSISGSFQKTISDWYDYLNLKSENESLAHYNSLLLNELANKQTESDTIITKEFFSFIPAHVINNSIYDMNNYIVIDKGRQDGIEPDMGVICDDGVVGKVLNVSENYASVMSLLNSNSVLSCRFIDNQHIANVVWDNVSYRYGKVKDIPSHIEITQGDTLITSGFSNSFPAGIMVGTIEEGKTNDNDLFGSAKLKFSTNFSTLRHVYVVKNNYKAEIDSLCITQ